MKKIILLSLILLAGSTLNTASAGKKKDKKKAQQTETKAIRLVTASDSMSYLAGKAATMGLIPYLQQQLKVDTAYMADVIAGYKDAATKSGDARFTAYMAGVEIGKMAQQRIIPQVSNELKGTKDSIQTALFNEGFLASLNGDNSLFADSTAQKMFDERRSADKKQLEEAYKEQNTAWLKDNATKPGVQVLPSGLQYKVIQQGNGVKPEKSQTVNVVYEGRLIDGTVFDATKNHRGAKSDAFRCDQVIKGWTEALTLMPVGSKWEIYIPQELAYGSRQAGQIKPYSTLIFTVELLSIEPSKSSETAQPTAKASKTTANSIKKY